MTNLRLVADDLTGALDSAAQFTGRLGAIPVLLGPASTARAGSFALDLNCRDGSEAEAVRRMQTTMVHLAGASIAFKKIDSLLRGHWAAELAAIAELGTFDRIVLAPAFPAQGRVTRQGRHYVRGHDGQWLTAHVDPTFELARRGVAVQPGRPGIVEVPRPASILLYDAETDQDLTEIVSAAQHHPGRTLWCGSADLARALARQAPPALEPPRVAHLVLVGSDHPVTHGQLTRLEQAHPRGLVQFGADADASVADIDRALARYGLCVAIPGLAPGLSAIEAEQQISWRLAAILPRLSRPEVLTVVGGETFAAVCRTHRCAVLAVEGEWRPGVPACRMVDGAWAGTRCFSKSGAFGGSGVLLDLLGSAADAPTSPETSGGAD